MNELIASPVAKYSGMLLTLAGVALVCYGMIAGDSFLSRYYHQYTSYLNRQLRLLFLPSTGTKIAAGQAAAVVVIVALAILVDLPLWYMALAMALGAPSAYLWQKRAEHIKQLEEQVDSFILGLANSLKTVPNPSAALSALAPVLTGATKLEIDRVLAEIRVGSTLEQGLLNMSSRLKSPNLDSALSAVLIGLQVGGNLPAVLENTAATIREMNRLDGVVKTKTAEGRAQLFVLAAFPFFIIWAFSSVQEGYFEPLQSSFIGHLVTTVAFVFWVAALVAARKILKVDV